MRKPFVFILTLAAGYVLGALLGALLIELISTNPHDRELEAIMTGAFITGPVGAVVALIGGFFWRR